MLQKANVQVKKELNISEMWCGRYSTHTNESVKSITQRLSRKASHGKSAPPHKTEVERQAGVMATKPQGLYERFRRGLLEYHSEVYIH
jgi:hypothetical protein